MNYLAAIDLNPDVFAPKYEANLTGQMKHTKRQVLK